MKLGVRMEFRDSLNKCAMALAKNLDRSEFGTRLTYNCAHLRSTKESLTISVKFFWVKIFG